MHGMIRKFLIYFFCIAALAKTNAAFAQNKSAITISFNHFVKDEVLQLDTVRFFNDVAQAYSVTMFKYYVGHFCLTTNTGKKINDTAYFLINEEAPESKNIALQGIPEGTYKSIDFMVGVDSMDNCSGAQAGALDPIHAMFWAWNTGYIFLKLEGWSNASASPGHVLEYHIGGYKAPANCIRKVHINFPENLQVNQQHQLKLALKVDISKLFGPWHQIDFIKLSSVTDFHNATTIADNYAQMFTYLSAN